MLLRRTLLVGLVGALFAAAAVLLGRQLGWLQPLELRQYDAQLTQVAARPPNAAERFVLVTMDERDHVLCGCSLDDANLALLLRRILAAGPRAIVLDLLRDKPIPPGTDALSEVLAGDARILLATALSAGVPPPPAVGDPDRIGFADMIIDGDGVVRRAGLFLGIEGQTRPSLALLAALAELAPDGLALEPDPLPPHWPRLGAARFEPLSRNFGPYVGLDSSGYQLALVGSPDATPPPALAVRDVLAAAAPLPSLADRIVLIGSVAPSSRDMFRAQVVGGAPGGMTYGVALQARIAAQLIAQARGELPVVTALPVWALPPIVMAAALLGAGLGSRPGWRLALLGLSLTLIAVAGALWLGTRGIWVPLVPPAAAALLALILVQGATRWNLRRERRDLEHILGTFVSPGIATALWAERQRLVAGGALRPVALTATVMFTDLRGFTSLTETMPPPMMIGWLDRYMTVMTDLVAEAGGVVEKFTGDGLMAVFGVPVPRVTPEGVAADAAAAAGCAVAMARRLIDLNAGWLAEGLPEARIRVGIATGLLTSGTIGSGRRRQFTVLGDAANTAQRLESLTFSGPEPSDQDHCRIFISQATTQQLGRTFVTEPLGRFAVRGKGEPVAVFRLRHDLTPAAAG